MLKSTLFLSRPEFKSQSDMSQSGADYILEKAVEKCSHSGVKLTKKRKQILQVLLNAAKPLSAYDVVEIYNQNSEQAMQAMSAYRILDFLVEEKLAHKLNLANQYIACAHISCSHPHLELHFLICRQCKKVKEIELPVSLMQQLKDSVAKSGFQFKNSQLELDCLCDQCASGT